jgi:hypothetical protein
MVGMEHAWGAIVAQHHHSGWVIGLVLVSVGGVLGASFGVAGWFAALFGQAWTKLERQFYLIVQGGGLPAPWGMMFLGLEKHKAKDPGGEQQLEGSDNHYQVNAPDKYVDLLGRPLGTPTENGAHYPLPIMPRLRTGKAIEGPKVGKGNYGFSKSTAQAEEGNREQLGCKKNEKSSNEEAGPEGQVARRACQYDGRQRGGGECIVWLLRFCFRNTTEAKTHLGTKGFALEAPPTTVDADGVDAHPESMGGACMAEFVGQRAKPIENDDAKNGSRPLVCEWVNPVDGISPPFGEGGLVALAGRLLTAWVGAAFDADPAAVQGYMLLLLVTPIFLALLAIR